MNLLPLQPVRGVDTRSRRAWLSIPALVAAATLLAAGPVTAAPMPSSATSVEAALDVKVSQVRTIDGYTGAGARGIAVTPDGLTVLVANLDTSTVSVIDASTGTQVGVVDSYSGTSPMRIGVSTDGSRAYVANYGSGTVSIIDLSTMTEVASVAGLNTPSGIAVTPDGTRAYVTEWGMNRVSIIDLTSATVTGQVTAFTGRVPSDISLSADGATAYVTHWGRSGVTEIDTTTNRQTREAKGYTGTTPSSPVLSPDGATLYVANEQSSFVSVFDARTLTETSTIVAGTSSSAMVLSSDGLLALTTDLRADAVTVIDVAAGTAIGTAVGYTGDSPQGVAFSPDESHAWVGGMRSHDVSELAVVRAPLAGPPATPEDFAATAANAEAHLSWSPPSDDGGAEITGYVLQQAHLKPDEWVTIAETTGTQSHATGLINGNAHHFRVAALNGHGQSPWTPVATAIPVDDSTPPIDPVDPAGPSPDLPGDVDIDPVGDTAAVAGGTVAVASPHSSSRGPLAFTGSDSPAVGIAAAASLLIVGLALAAFNARRRRTDTSHPLGDTAL